MIPLFLCFAVVASAHDAVYLPAYEVQGRESSLHGVAMSASQGVVGGEDLLRATGDGASDILASVPGMVATQHSGSGKAKQYFLRGFNLDHGTDFAAFVDGMPVNLPTHGHGQGYADTNFLIPEFVSLMSYYKGSYYAMIGDFSSSGSASVSLRDVLESDFMEISVAEDARYRWVGGASRAWAGGDVLMGLELEENDGPWALDENLGKRNGMFRYSVGNYDERLSVTAMAYDSSWDSTDQIPERAVESGEISDWGYIDPTVGGRTTRYSLSANWKKDQGHVRSFATLYSIYYDMNLWSNFTYFLDNPELGDQFEQADRRMVHGFTLGRTFFYQEFLGKQTNHTFALQTRWDDIDRVGLYGTQARERWETKREDEVETLSTALAYEMKVDWSPKLTSFVGARLERTEHESESLVGLPGGRASDSVLSPKFNLSYTPSDDWEFYVSAGEGFHSNDARAASIEEDVDVLAQSEGAELGARFQITDTLNSSFSVWQLDLDSELLYVGDAGETEASRPSERWGVDWTSFVSLGDRWSADIDVSWSSARFSDFAPEGNEIPGVVERKAGGSVNYAWGDKGRATLSFRHLGGRPLTEDGSVRSESSSSVHAAVTGAISNWEWTVRLDNVFDSRDPDISYFYESRLRSEAMAVEDVHTHVMKPRTLSLRLRRYF